MRRALSALATGINRQAVNGLCLCMVIALLFGTQAFGTDRFANPGNLAEQVRAAAAGDVIILKNGTYTDTYHLVLNKHGVTLKAQEPGRAVFTGVNTNLVVQASNVTVAGLLFDTVTNPEGSNVKWVIRVIGPATTGQFSGIRITACAFLNCGHRRLGELNAGNIRIDNFVNNSVVPTVNNPVTGCRVDRCYFFNSSVCGIKFGAGIPQNVVIERNYFRHFHWPGKENGNEPIATGQGSTPSLVANTLIQHNYFEDVLTVPGGEPEIISVKSARNTIQFNTVRNATYYGTLTLRDCHSATVRENFLLGAGLRLYGRGHRILANYFDGSATANGLTGLTIADLACRGFELRHCEFAENTFVNAQVALRLVHDPDGRRFAQNTFRQNRFFTTRPAAYVVVGTFQNASPDSLNAWSGNIAWSTAHYDGRVTSCTDAAPQPDPAGATSSPARFTRAKPNLRFDPADGIYRVVGAKSSAGAPVRRPFSARSVGREVGPAWLTHEAVLAYANRARG